MSTPADENNYREKLEQSGDSGSSADEDVLLRSSGDESVPEDGFETVPEGPVKYKPILSTVPKAPPLPPVKSLVTQVLTPVSVEKAEEIITVDGEEPMDDLAADPVPTKVIPATQSVVPTDEGVGPEPVGTVPTEAVVPKPVKDKTPAQKPKKPKKPKVVPVLDPDVAPVPDTTNPSPAAAPVAGEGATVPPAEVWTSAETRRAKRRRAKKAHKRDAEEASKRPYATLASIQDAEGRHWPPARNPTDGGLSDDEDWMDDTTHPIEWYVTEFLSAIDSNLSSLEAELRMKLTYAWSFYAPGDPCPFVRCRERSGGRAQLTFTTLARYARHLCEVHLPTQTYLYCVSIKGQNTACKAWTDGEYFRTNRRGDMVRHLMKNGGHKRPLVTAVNLVYGAWGSQAGSKCVGKMEKRVLVNGLSRRFRLTDHDWALCSEKSPGFGTQSPVGDAGKERTAKECSPVNTTTGTKRSRSNARGQEGRTDSENRIPKKPKTSTTSRRASRVVTEKSVPATPKLPVAGPSLSKVKTRQVKQWVKLAASVLNTEDAAKLKSAFLEQEASNQVSVVPTTQVKIPGLKAGASATVTGGNGGNVLEVHEPVGGDPVPGQTETIGAVGALGADAVAAKQTVSPSAPQEGSEVAMEEAYSPISSATEGQGEPDVETPMAPVPDPGIEFARVQNRQVRTMRDSMTREFSQMMATQIGAFESYFVEGLSMVASDMNDSLAKERQQDAANLALERQSLSNDSLYYINRYKKVQSRMDMMSEHFFRQFGMSLEDWQEARFPAVRPLGTTAMRMPPPFPGAGLSAAVGSSLSQQHERFTGFGTMGPPRHPDPQVRQSLEDSGVLRPTGMLNFMSPALPGVSSVTDATFLYSDIRIYMKEQVKTVRFR